MSYYNSDGEGYTYDDYKNMNEVDTVASELRNLAKSVTVE